MNLLLKKALLIVSAFTFVVATQAQVTIGSFVPPKPGALLDIKSMEDDEAQGGGRNADKGLLLPRIVLKSINTLNDIAGNISESDYLEYTGLVVYNIGSCLPTGITVWTGTRWVNPNNSAYTTGYERDSLALVAIYKANPNSNLGVNSTVPAERWGTGTPIDTWSGVTVSVVDATCNEKRVTAISLPSKNITTIPSEIGNLTAMTSFRLGGNLISSLPEELFTLTNLESLRFGNNSITHLSSAIGNLVNLTDLVFSYNLLREENFPTTFTNIPAYCLDTSDHVAQSNSANNPPFVLLPQRDNLGNYITFIIPVCTP